MDTWLLETERLRIKEVDEEIAKRVSENINDGEDMTSFMKSIPESVLKEAIADSNQVLAFVKAIASAHMTKDVIRFGAWTHADELIAYVGLSNVSTEVSELQIMVMREHQGEGYATELLTALIPYLFKKYGFDRIVYRLRTNNIPSEKLINKLGGVIQKPNSRIEELTVKTYHIVRS